MQENLEQKKLQQNISWGKDLRGSSLIQRNLLWALNFILGISIVICLIWMQTTISQNKIEPFVIEIDKKTGVATIVNQLSVNEYSSNTAVLKYLIIQYIRAREGYLYETFDSNFFDVVRVFSSPSIYYGYRSAYGKNNPNSPYNIFGKGGRIDVKWKSVIFPANNTAQVRIALQTTNAAGSTDQVNKIILMSFEFNAENQMSEEDRLINPLGFNVKMYKIEDENPNT